MPHHVSPGVFVNEFDFSDYAPALGLATLALLGGATKGKLNTPTAITNENDLVRVFGKPVLTDYGLQAAVQFLKRGNRLLYTRVANGAITADIPVGGTAAGTPAVKSSGEVAFLLSAVPSDGDNVTIRDRVPTANVNNDGTGAIGNQLMVSSNPSVVAVTGLSGGAALPVPVQATGTIKFVGSTMPSDGDTVAINDGATTVTFEFDDNSSVVETPTLRQVVIVTGDPYATMAALIAKIQAHAFNVSAVSPVVVRIFEFDSNAVITPGSIGVLRDTGSAANTMSNLIAAIAANATFVSVQSTTVTIPKLTVTHNTGGIDGNALISTNASGNISVTGMSGGVNAIAGANMTVMVISAFSPGSWANGNKVNITPTVIIGAPVDNFDITVEAAVDDSGLLAIVERFSNLSLTSTDARFIETILADGVRGEVNPSRYIIADVAPGAGVPTAATFVLGNTGGGGTAGVDGITGLVAADYVGTVSAQTSTGLKALRNPETTEFNILAIPGVSNSAVINEMLLLAQTRGDAIAIVDPPLGLSFSEAIAWHNGVSTVPNAPTTVLNTSYGALYWGWVKEFDPYNKKNIFMPPSGFAAAVYAFTDRAIGPWVAPAGHTRGLITGLEVEYSPTLSERDQLVGGQNRVNPIVNFASTGLTIFGNRTLQRRPTALDSVHVRRMLLHAEKLCATAVKYLVFEPNDPVTWRRFTNLVNPILDYIKANRGLEEFRVICDASTNPPSQRQNKTMKGKILLKAIDAAEIIELDFALFATGAEFTTEF